MAAAPITDQERRAYTRASPVTWPGTNNPDVTTRTATWVAVCAGMTLTKEWAPDAKPLAWGLRGIVGRSPAITHEPYMLCFAALS
jgi:hypothetical protein